VAHTLAVGRRPLHRRAAVLARDTADAATALRALAAGDAPVSAAGGGPVSGGSVFDGAPEALRDRAAAWLAGGEISADAGRRVPLPGYPFQRTRHWIDPVEPANPTGAGS
jgi:acyl transferase domain-containing protein